MTWRDLRGATRQRGAKAAEAAFVGRRFGDGQGEMQRRERAARAGAALGRVRRSGLRPDCAAVLGSGAPPCIYLRAPCGRTPNRHGESEVDARLRRATPPRSCGPRRLSRPNAAPARSTRRTRGGHLANTLRPSRRVAAPDRPSTREGAAVGFLSEHHHWFCPVVGRPLWACLRGAAQHRRNGRRAAGAHPPLTRRTCSQCACKAHGDKCTARPGLR